MENQRSKTRMIAAQYLMREVGNFIQNSETGRAVERVNMVGGVYLLYDENGQVDGFVTLSGALDYIGL